MRRGALVMAALCGCRLGFGEWAASDAARVADALDYDAALAACATSAQLVPASGAISGMLAAGSGTAGSCGGDGVAELAYAIDVPAGSGLIAAADGPSTTGNDLVYIRSDCADAATEFACDLDGGTGDQSQIRILSVPAGRYYVFVDGEGGATGAVDGEVVLQLPQGAACSGDTMRDRCAPELTCSGGTCQPVGCAIAETFTTTGSFSRMPTTMGSSLHAGTCGQASDGGARAPEVVYRVSLAAAISDLHVSTDSPMTTFDTLIYVRQGCTGAELACNDDVSTGNSLASDVRTGPLAAGDYYVFIDGFSTHSGTAALTITITP